MQMLAWSWLETTWSRELEHGADYLRALSTARARAIPSPSVYGLPQLLTSDLCHFYELALGCGIKPRLGECSLSKARSIKSAFSQT